MHAKDPSLPRPCFKHRLPTGPLASRLRGAGGGPVDNLAPVQFDHHREHLG
jgi:hypothetical protein